MPTAELKPGERTVGRGTEVLPLLQQRPLPLWNFLTSALRMFPHVPAATWGDGLSTPEHTTQGPQVLLAWRAGLGAPCRPSLGQELPQRGGKAEPLQKDRNTAGLFDMGSLLLT